MIIKEKPEDFVVIEELEEEYKKNVSFFTEQFFEELKEKIKKDNSKYFLIKILKKNFSHFKMLEELKKYFKLKEKNFGIPGIKDKKAITTQYITVQNNNYVKKKILENIKENKIFYKKVYDENTIEEKSLVLELVGTTNKQLTIGMLEENNFIIRIKSLKEEEKQKFLELKKTIESYKNIDENKQNKQNEQNNIIIPNYFGIQRFGIESYNPIIGYYILKQEYDKAVEYIKKQALIEEKNNSIETIKNISRKKRMLYISSFQSVIFNIELKEKILSLKNKKSSLKKILEENKEENKNVKNKNEENVLELLKQLILYSLDYEFLNLEEQKKILEENKLQKNFFEEEITIIAFDRNMNEFKKNILKKLHLKETSFIIKQMPDLMFEPYNRKIFQNINIKSIEDKKSIEDNNIILEFSLKKGSYATITLEAIKQI